MDIVLPPRGQGPGVLVVHPWWGLNETIRNYGKALAAEGFVVGLPDLFEGTTATAPAEAETLADRFWPEALARLDDALGELTRHAAVTAPDVGAVGFSFGGFHLLRLIGPTAPSLRAVVVYYAAHVGNFRSGQTQVLAHFAEDDPFDGPEAQRDMADALAAAGAGMTQMHADTRHWFAEADRPEYDMDAAHLAFGETVAFLHAHL